MGILLCRLTISTSQASDQMHAQTHTHAHGICPPRGAEDIDHDTNAVPS